MIGNYVNTAVRNLRSHWLYTFINVGGLAVGIAAFIMISLFLQFEYSFDRGLPNYKEVFRICQRKLGDAPISSDMFSATPIQLATDLVNEFPEVKSATRVLRANALVRFSDNTFWESGLNVDDKFFTIFPFELIRGNALTALDDPQSIVLTNSLAAKLFGGEEPIGKIIQYEDKGARMVTGILRDIPENNSLQFSFLVLFSGDRGRTEEMAVANWRNSNAQTFFTLRDGSPAGELEKKFPAMIARHHDPESYKKYHFKDEFVIQPLKDIHFANGMNFDIGVKGNKTYVLILAAIAVLVLSLACINYMNLAIARSIKREKEVALRKVVGALRKQLIGQFLGESVLLALVSLVLATLLTYLFLPQFSSLVERKITLDFHEHPNFLLAILFLAVIVGVLAGSYPAFIVSRLRPAGVLKGNASSLGTGNRLRRSLIVIQFSVSIVLLTSTIAIHSQLQYIRSKNLGINRDHIVVVNARDPHIFDHYDALRQQWQQNPNIQAITVSEDLPINIQSRYDINDDDQDKSDDLSTYKTRVGLDYLKVFELRLIVGRDFNPDIPSDFESAKIINEKAAIALGWQPESAVGKQFDNDGIRHTVIGVVQDFNLHNLHLPVEPLILDFYRPNYGMIFFKVTSDNIPTTISFLKQTLASVSHYPFVYQFLDDSFDQMYKGDILASETLSFFTSLSLIITTLGLFGLAAFVADQRTREIGIRKVLGASVGNIVSLVSGDFLKLVIIAFVISAPIAWYILNRWLEDFQYHVGLEWWMFAAAGVLALLIAILSTAYQSLRASRTDPIKCINRE